MSPERVEDTQIASAEDLSGHINYDYTFPSVPSRYKTPGPGRLRVADDNRHLKEAVVIQDISADQHGSWINGVKTPNHVTGFPYKAKEVS